MKNKIACFVLTCGLSLLGGCTVYTTSSPYPNYYYTPVYYHPRPVYIYRSYPSYCPPYYHR